MRGSLFARPQARWALVGGVVDRPHLNCSFATRTVRPPSASGRRARWRPASARVVVSVGVEKLRGVDYVCRGQRVDRARFSCVRGRRGTERTADVFVDPGRQVLFLVSPRISFFVFFRRRKIVLFFNDMPFFPRESMCLYICSCRSWRLLVGRGQIPRAVFLVCSRGIETSALASQPMYSGSRSPIFYLARPSC